MSSTVQKELKSLKTGWENFEVSEELKDFLEANRVQGIMLVTADGKIMLARNDGTEVPVSDAGDPSPIKWPPTYSGMIVPCYCGMCYIDIEEGTPTSAICL